MIQVFIDKDSGTVLGPAELYSCELSQEEYELAMNSDSEARRLAEEKGRPVIFMDVKDEV